MLLIIQRRPRSAVTNDARTTPLKSGYSRKVSTKIFYLRNGSLWIIWAYDFPMHQKRNSPRPDPSLPTVSLGCWMNREKKVMVALGNEISEVPLEIARQFQDNLGHVIWRAQLKEPSIYHRVPKALPGERVRVQFGALADVEGVLVRHASRGRLIVSVDLLQRSIAVEIDADQVMPV
jgi:hypothetical protein